ncbi:ovostatin-like [Oratosquilla oratoria]|uniref:ovostatin-like n=1 Tax=Oratosquilla oratoria TaxID=337810 RepID=UPI003F76C5F0
MWELTVLVAIFVVDVQGSYVITAPRIITPEKPFLVCLQYVDEVAGADDYLNVTVEEYWRSSIASFALPIEEGQTSKCYPVEIPQDQSDLSFGTRRYVTFINFEGTLGNNTVFESRELAFEEVVYLTFVQTEKYVYQPTQTVRFRILTFEGVSARVYAENYPEIYVKAPSGKRIKHWSDVDNSAGLVHLQFDLIEEAEEGKYQIVVKKKDGYNYMTVQDFEVKDYVAPKFVVTVVVPEVIYGTNDSGVIRVCANYTFGKPVKGKATLHFSEWQYFFASQVTKHKEIDGCTDFELALEEMDNNGYHPLSQMDVIATVAEEGTGIERNSSRKTIEIRRMALRFNQGNFTASAKPGLPALIQLWVANADGTKAASEPMQACLNTLCKNFTTDSDGLLSFQIPPSALTNVSEEFGNYLEIAAVNYPDVMKDNSSFNYVMYKSAIPLSITPYMSPTNSSLLLRVPYEEIQCQKEQEIEVDLMFSAFNQSWADITVQVISRGEILYQNTSRYDLVESSLPIDFESLTSMEPIQDVVTGSIKIPVTIPEADSSKIKVLAWYSRHDGEVVSDVAALDMRKCLADQVDMSWSAETSEPGEEVTLTLGAKPGSLCSFGVAGKNMGQLPHAMDFLTLEGISNIIMNDDRSQWTFCQNGIPSNFNVSHYDFDLVMHSDTGRTEYGSFPFLSTTLHRDAFSVFEESGLFFITDMTTETMPCFSRPLGHSGFRGDPLGIGIMPEHEISWSYGCNEGRIMFSRDTWLWDLEVIPSTGQSIQTHTLPDIVTEWVGKSVCVLPNKRLGISGKASITTFTPFFIELELPPSVKRGEILPVHISVYNYLNDSLPVKVVIAKSEDFDILEDEVVAGGERSMCVESNDKTTHIIRIKLKEIGDIPLNVTASVDDAFPESCGSENITKIVSLTKSINVEAEGFPREKAWSAYFCSKEVEDKKDSVRVWDVRAPEDEGVVEGSERAFVAVTGDLLGDSLKRLHYLMQIPFGNGEHNMLLFAPDVYILHYQKVSGNLSDSFLKRSQEYLKLGYENQQDYRHKDGSYGAFLDSTVPRSTWLTAFVVKVFVQASSYIFIDQDELEDSLDWLQEQQLETGCFGSLGSVFHKDMQGGVGLDSSDISLTAYVLITLLEAGETSQDNVIQRAIDCLIQQQQQEILSPYVQAITSYALALAEHPEAEQVFQELLLNSTESSNSISWHLPAGMDQELKMEISGYVLLTMMKLGADDYDDMAFKIVKWIARTVDANGGFTHTQGIVIALQGLAAFASAHKQNISDLIVTIEAENLLESFEIKKYNKMVHHYSMLPVVPSNVSVNMKGQGCALVQVVLRYNVLDPHPTDAFDLNVETGVVLDNVCNTNYITACASYLLPVQEFTETILEIGLISGYVPNKEDLRVITDSTQITNFHVNGSKVFLRTEEVIDEKLCFFFRVTREIDVENTVPGTVRVYNHDQPEFFIEKSYVFPPVTECYNSFRFISNIDQIGPT